MVAAAKKAIDGRRTDTRERILDTAEHLLAEHGYDRVSVRDITGKAGINLALVTYHFGTKERLLECVIERRAEVLNKERQAALKKAMTSDAPSVADVMSAFVEPFLRRINGDNEGWRNYCRLIAAIGPTGRWPQLLSRLFDGNAKVFVDALMVIEPSLDKLSATRAFLSCVGTMMTSLQSDLRFGRLTGQGPTNYRVFLAHQIVFMAGGVTAAAKFAAKEKTRKKLRLA